MAKCTSLSFIEQKLVHKSKEQQFKTVFMINNIALNKNDWNKQTQSLFVIK
jgi:hypothetical protein